MPEIKLKKRYVSAQDVYMTLISNTDLGIARAIEFMKELPTADVVDVVRCRDCKHADEHVDSDGWFMCHYHGVYMTSKNEFCSYGERKDGNT